MRAIDADALKDVIQQHDYPLADRLNSIDTGMFTLGIFQAIDEQPTLSPDDVRGVGKWTQICPTQSMQFTWERFKCSACESASDSTYNYCPDCGAKMLK
jgi:hypothetical protein